LRQIGCFKSDGHAVGWLKGTNEPYIGEFKLTCHIHNVQGVGIEL